VIEEFSLNHYTNGCKCNKHPFCGQSIKLDTVLCLSCTVIENLDGKEDEAIGAFTVSEAINKCCFGFMPYYIVFHKHMFDSQVVLVTRLDYLSNDPYIKARSDSKGGTVQTKSILMVYDREFLLAKVRGTYVPVPEPRSEQNSDLVAPENSFLTRVDPNASTTTNTTNRNNDHANNVNNQQVAHVQATAAPTVAVVAATSIKGGSARVGWTSSSNDRSQQGLVVATSRSTVCWCCHLDTRARRSYQPRNTSSCY
jgi:hypothetical protein